MGAKRPSIPETIPTEVLWGRPDLDKIDPTGDLAIQAKKTNAAINKINGPKKG